MQETVPENIEIFQSIFGDIDFLKEIRFMESPWSSSVQFEKFSEN